MEPYVVWASAPGTRQANTTVATMIGAFLINLVNILDSLQTDIPKRAPTRTTLKHFRDTRREEHRITPIRARPHRRFHAGPHIFRPGRMTIIGIGDLVPRYGLSGIAAKLAHERDQRAAHH